MEETEDFGALPEGVSEEVAEEVAEAYHYRCAVGGSCEGRLQIHHVKPRGRGGSNRRANLVLLCQKHHDDEHAGKGHGWILGSRDPEPDEFPSKRPPGMKGAR